MGNIYSADAALIPTMMSSASGDLIVSIQASILFGKTLSQPRIKMIVPVYQLLTDPKFGVQHYVRPELSIGI